MHKTVLVSPRLSDFFKSRFNTDPAWSFGFDPPIFSKTLGFVKRPPPPLPLWLFGLFGFPEFPLHCILDTMRLLTGKPYALLTTVPLEGRSAQTWVGAGFSHFWLLFFGPKLPLSVLKSDIIARLTSCLLPTNWRAGGLSQTQPSALPEQMRVRGKNVMLLKSSLKITFSNVFLAKWRWAQVMHTTINDSNELNRLTCCFDFFFLFDRQRTDSH